MKRILLYRFGRPPVEGVIRPESYLSADEFEFMTIDGDVQLVPHREVKAICFLSESGRADLFTDNNLFERRPKANGLWVRFTLRDGDLLEGLLSHNLTEWPNLGFLLTPPRAGASRQRVFLPRTSLSGTELLGVIGAAASGSPARKVRAAGGQLRMFDP